MVAVKKNQPLTVQNTNKTVRDTPKMSHQPVGVWSERPTFRENIKKRKFLLRGFSTKICTSENFLLCGNYSSSQVVPVYEHNIVGHKWRERGNGENLGMAHSWERS